VPTRPFAPTMLLAWQAERKAICNQPIRQPYQATLFTVKARPAARLRGYSEKLKTLPHRLRRCRQRQWKRSLASVALLMALGQAPAIAATINLGKTCTLVRAITAANNDTPIKRG
jgi:hypothetical protein